MKKRELSPSLGERSIPSEQRANCTKPVTSQKGPFEPKVILTGYGSKSPGFVYLLPVIEIACFHFSSTYDPATL